MKIYFEKTGPLKSLAPTRRAVGAAVKRVGTHAERNEAEEPRTVGSPIPASCISPFG